MCWSPAAPADVGPAAGVDACVAAVEELAAPRIGNPWGYVVDGHVLYEPVFEYHYQARYFQGLVADVLITIVAPVAPAPLAVPISPSGCASW